MEIGAKGDPLRGDWTRLYQILSEGSADFAQFGLTTPGDRIPEASSSFIDLIGWNLTNLTLNIPHHLPEKRRTLFALDIDYQRLTGYLKKECHVVVRAACCLSKKGIASPQDVLDFVAWCRQIGIQQVVFRETGTPDDVPDGAVRRWRLENAVEMDFHESWNFESPGRNVLYVKRILEMEDSVRPVLVSSLGEMVFEIEGVSVTFEKDEKNYYGNSIARLIFSGNHLYARWESEGTIIL